jgi:apolipoprotein N-acyltransferase
LDLPGLPPVGMLICYEAIFPGAVVDEAHRPDWMLNVTNDGWYGVSSGPYQHFAAARMRAIEEGLPFVRNANNGISAVIDPYGRVTAMLGLNAVGTVDAPLPTALSPTLFSRMGPLALVVLLGIALGFALMGNFLGNRRAS